MSMMRIFVLIIFILALLSMATDYTGKYNEGVRSEQGKLASRANGDVSFGVYGDWGDDRPLKRMAVAFLSFLSFLVLSRKSKRPIATIFSIVSFLILVHWGLKVSEAMYMDWEVFGRRSWCQLLLIAANPVDYLLFGSITVLLTWQVLLLLRVSSPGAQNPPNFS